MTVLPWATNDATSAVAEEGCVHYITDYGLKKACMKLAVSLSCNSSHKITVIKFIILFVCLCFKLQSISIDSKSLLRAPFLFPVFHSALKLLCLY